MQTHTKFPILFASSRRCAPFWQRLVVLLWLHNLCWYGCCLNKQPPETARAGESERGCIMMKLWLRAYSSRYTHEHWQSCVFFRAPSAFHFISSEHFVCFLSCSLLKANRKLFHPFCFCDGISEENIPQPLKTWHTWRSMWKIILTEPERRGNKFFLADKEKLYNKRENLWHDTVQ